jgi:hypothetical protein
MLRLGIAACAAVAPVLGEGFTFTIDSPVPSLDLQARSLRRNRMGLRLRSYIRSGTRGSGAVNSSGR